MGGYMNNLIEYANVFPQVSDSDFLKSQERLQKNMKQKSFFREKQYCIQKGETITRNYADENHRRSYFWDCQFLNSDFSNMGMSGSMFKETTFLDCKIYNTKLDSCAFESCNFITSERNLIANNQDGNLINLNLSKSTVVQSNFENCTLLGANFTDSVFVDVTFKNCVWQSLALENSIFKNTIFDSVVIKKLNFEFSQFEDVKMNNVRLPFPTIPYIFNGLSYILNTTDNVVISSANSPTGSISTLEYAEYLKDLETFYIKTQNFFPLANIYISLNKKNEAFAAIVSGIQHAMQLHSYRMVYYYCKLLKTKEYFSDIQCLNIYNMIVNCMNHQEWSLAEFYSIKKYIDPIRSLLLNEQASSSLTISVSTNIEHYEIEKLSKLIQVIEETISFIKDSDNNNIKHYIEVRHHCPFDLFLKVFGSYESLLLVAGFLHFIFTSTDKIYDKVIKYRKNYFEGKIQKAQLRNLELDNQLKERALSEPTKPEERVADIDNQNQENYVVHIRNQSCVLKAHNINIVSGNQTIVGQNIINEDRDLNYYNY